MRFVVLSSNIINEKIARPIMNNKGQVLIARNTVITKKILRKLQQLGITSIYIVSEIKSDLDDVIDLTERKKEVSEFKEFTNGLIYNMNKSGNSSVNKRIKIYRNINKQIDAIATKLINSVNYSRKISMVDIKSAEDYLFEHQINVCILSIYIGRKLHYNNKNIKKLAKAALIFDYGCLLLENKDLISKLKLTDEERKEYKTHTTLGYDFLRNNLDFSITEIIPSLEHHERVNGTGYPRGITGDKMHEFSRIIAIADAYDELTSSRIGKPAFPQSEAIEFLMGSAGSLYDFEFVNIFVKNIIPYPRGSKVMLSNGDVGFVINQNRDLPLRPKVIVVEGDKKGLVDLADETNVTISKVIIK
ncbi:HD-GYP domain-containing protein [Clostridiaceae bacterium HSG29]|nr:HD-GYP domain-containing protein [Clostridiaceae bacterium HSG29]